MFFYSPLFVIFLLFVYIFIYLSHIFLYLSTSQSFRLLVPQVLRYLAQGWESVWCRGGSRYVEG